MLAALLNLAKNESHDPLLDSPGLKGLSEKVALLSQHSWQDTSLESGRFVVVDTETTGFYPYHGDEIISFGAVVIEKGQIRETFSSLVNPGRKIPPKATKITGITDEMVSKSPDVLTVLDDFFAFIGTNILIGHSLQFDFAFINAKLNKYYGHKLRQPVLDTFLLSHVIHPKRKDHSLDFLARSYSIPLTGRHTALGDCIITGEVFLRMRELLLSRGIKQTSRLVGRF